MPRKTKAAEGAVGALPSVLRHHRLDLAIFVRALLALLAFVAPATLAQSSGDLAARSNVFNDPFLQVTAGLAGCAVPEPPGVTAQEARDLAHDRSQRGVSCWLAGRCRLANSYQYDAEIIPRVRQAIRVDGRFDDTSIWVTGQRRWVWLQGCVATAEQSSAVERLVRDIDDVERVINQLSVGASGEPAYRVAPR